MADEHIVLGPAFGTEAQIATYQGFPDAVGELVWSTDGHRPYFFDGTKMGGWRVAMHSELPAVMRGATASAAGAAGLVPAPAAGANAYLLRGDGTWIAVATQGQAEAGTDDAHPMTALKTKQAIAKFGFSGNYNDLSNKPDMSAVVPAGMIAFFAFSSIPDGWLLCNGSSVSRTTYARLFAAIGTKYGSGDGSTTFGLPDLDGRFLEGTTDTSKVGNYVEAGLPNITGGFPTDTFLIGQHESYGAFSDHSISGNSRSTAIMSTFNETRIDASRSNSIYDASNTVQVPSMTTLPCIKT